MNIKKLTKAFLYSLFIVLTQIVFSKLFGSKNALVGVILALGGIVFLKRDFTGRFWFRFLSFLGINISLGIISYIARINVYTGVILNLSTIFLITYTYMNNFRPPTSYTFLMSYIFMYTIPISINELPIRLLAIFSGVCIIMVLQLIFNKNKFKEKSDMMIENIIKEMQLEIEQVINENYDENVSIKIHGKIRNLIILIRERSHRKFKNNKYELNKFNIAICLSRLNMIISCSANYNGDKERRNNFLKKLKSQLGNIEKFNKGLENIDYIEKDLIEFINGYSDKRKHSKIIDETIYALKIFIEGLNNSKEYQDSILEEVYTTINIPLSFNILESMRENFSFKSLRFRYSLRLSVAISLAILFISFLNLKHENWIILSIYVVLQPYSEDSITKAKERFLGVTVGVILYFITFYILKDHISKTIILLLAFTGYFYFVEYSKKVITLTIISLASISLVENIGILSFSRFFLVFTGICVALLFNKFLLPYNIEDSIRELKSKYKKCTKLILEELEQLKNGKGNISIIISNSIKRNQIENNLIKNENKINNNNIEKMIYQQSIKMSECEYEFLKSYYLNFYSKKIS
ncbi:FUSC family protein [Romboutsia sp.]|uniref:FUSC family protein n=1 Tax=Romboutsia sp. TaxID=1965302 RepID=UPI003F315E7A